MPVARRGSLWPVVVLLLGLFVWGGWQVIFAPIEAGDVYPPYSSLRSDPLGAKVLYESLTELPELKVSRLYKPRTPLHAGTTLFILGVNSLVWSFQSKMIFDEYERLLKDGGRVVVGFLPEQTARREQNDAEIQQQWDMRPRYRNPSADEPQTSAIPKKSALYFLPGPQWRVLARDEGVVVAMEREIGKGSLVLVADSYRLSNQGLAELGEGARIAELVGPAQSVIFDEDHFGVKETGGVAVLLRKYRLEPALAMLMLVAGLFIWRSAANFLPAQDRPADGNADERSRNARAVKGRDSQAGLASLLRRSIPENQLLPTCLTEWTRSAPQDQRVESVAAEIKQWTGRDPMEGYRAACRAASPVTSRVASGDKTEK